MRKIKHLDIILIGVCILLVSRTNGYTQESYYTQTKNLQAPSVATFNTYGNIPANLYTGVPNISIPLFDVEEDGISVSFSLSYNPHNVKPNVHPGETGLGWNLLGGGNITRSVKGSNFDENSYIDPVSGKKVTLGYLGTEHRLADNWWTYETNTKYKNWKWNSTDRLKSEYADYHGENVHDCSPDKFSFNFLNYSGSFYRDHLGNWVVDSETPFQVSHTLMINRDTRATISEALKNGYMVYKDIMLATNTLLGFTLTAPDGTIFEFGGNVNAIDYSLSYFNQRSYRNLPIATTWHLTKIYPPHSTKDSPSIEFIYKEAPPVIEGNVDFWMQTNLFLTENKGMGFQLILPVSLSEVKNKTMTVLKFAYAESKQLGYKEIYYKEFGERFVDQDIRLNIVTYGPDDDNRFFYLKRLSDLKWQQLSYIENCIDRGMQTRFNFYYTSNTAERLKLLKLSKISTGYVSESYNFAYNEQKLPDYLSGHYDYLGFYNGRDFSQTFISDFYDYGGKEKMKKNADTFHSLRFPNAKFATAEMLNKITYPTKGYSVLEFEGNLVKGAVSLDRTKIDSWSHYGGGVRIKKITNFLDDGTFATSKYFYYVENFDTSRIGDYKEENQNPSGILGFTPKYYWEIDNYAILASGCTNQAYAAINEGHFIGYSEVTECEEDAVGKINGYTTYKYTNFSDFFDYSPITKVEKNTSPQTPFSSRGKMRGKLKSKEIYDAASKLKYGQYYAYGNTTEKTVRDLSYYTLKRGSQGGYVREGLGGSYYHYIFNNLLTSETEKTITDYGVVEKTKNYTYNEDNLLKTEESTSSLGKKVKIQKKYSGDLFRENSNYESHYIFNQMKVRNMNSYPIEEITLIDNQVVKGQVIDYAPLTYSGGIYPSRIYEFESETPINVGIYKSATIVGNNLVIDSRNKLSQLNSSYYAKPIPEYIETSSSKTVYLWSYSERYIIAKIENATYDEVIKALGYTEETYNSQFRIKTTLTAADWVKINKLRTSLPNSLVTTYDYRPYKGITKITDPREGASLGFRYYDASGKLSDSYIEVTDPNDKTKKINRDLQYYKYNYKNR